MDNVVKEQRVAMVRGASLLGMGVFDPILLSGGVAVVQECPFPDVGEAVLCQVLVSGDASTGDGKRRRMPIMLLLRKTACFVTFTLAAGMLAGSAAGQDTSKRGRKYKAPPATSHIEVAVTKGTNQKPIANAAVIFHAVKDGKDEGNLEIKTDEDGKAMIDIIATGSAVDVQVIAQGFATFAGQYQVDEPKREIKISMAPPRAQVSAYQDNSGKASDRQWGVQEPTRPTTPPVTQTPKPTDHTSDPSPRAPVSSTPPL